MLNLSQYFGWVETVGGGVKILLVFALCIGLWVVAGPGLCPRTQVQTSVFTPI